MWWTSASSLQVSRKETRSIIQQLGSMSISGMMSYWGFVQTACIKAGVKVWVPVLSIALVFLPQVCSSWNHVFNCWQNPGDGWSSSDGRSAGDVHAHCHRWTPHSCPLHPATALLHRHSQKPLGIHCRASAGPHHSPGHLLKVRWLHRNRVGAGVDTLGLLLSTPLPSVQHCGLTISSTSSFCTGPAKCISGWKDSHSPAQEP